MERQRSAQNNDSIYRLLLKEGQQRKLHGCRICSSSSSDKSVTVFQPLEKKRDQELQKRALAEGEAEAKREVGANSEEVKTKQI